MPFKSRNKSGVHYRKHRILTGQKRASKVIGTCGDPTRTRTVVQGRPSALTRAVACVCGQCFPTLISMFFRPPFPNLRHCDEDRRLLRGCSCHINGLHHRVGNSGL